jgi:flagellar basal body-associated protein FliL
MREETPQQKKRVLILGWTIIVIIFLSAAVAAVFAVWPTGEKTIEPNPQNLPLAQP